MTVWKVKHVIEILQTLSHKVAFPSSYENKKKRQWVSTPNPPLTSDKLFVDQKSAKRIQYKLPNGIWIIPNAKPNLLKSKAFNALKGKFFKNLNFSLSQWNAKAISGWTGRNFENFIRSQDPMLEFAIKDEGTRFLLILSRCNCINLATISRFINRIYFIFPA